MYYVKIYLRIRFLFKIYKIINDLGSAVKHFLKICATFNEKPTDNETRKNAKRICYADSNILQTKLRDSGVKKLILLAIVPEVQETHFNISQIWNLLKLNDVIKKFENKVSISADLKLINILLGLMSHSSFHPCRWCDANRNNLHKQEISRSIFNITEKLQYWQKNGSNLSNAKLYGNCVNEPIITNCDVNQSIIEIIPPPELHLLLGSVNTIYNSLLQKYPEEAIQWAKHCNVEREAMHGNFTKLFYYKFRATYAIYCFRRYI